MDYLDPALPVLIRTARSVVNWSQQELADRAGVAFNTIGRIERCETTGRAKTFKAIVDCFEQAGLTMTVEGGAFGLSIRDQLAAEMRQQVRKTQMSEGGAVPASGGSLPQTRVRQRKITLEDDSAPQTTQTSRASKRRVRLDGD